MNHRNQSHFFWGPYAPLEAMTGLSLLVLASIRLAFALFCAGALVWVFCISALVYFSAKNILPRKGRFVILLFLSSFICSVYILFAALLNPIFTESAWFFTLLVPPCFIASNVVPDLEGLIVEESLPRVFLEAASLGLLIIAISLIREPLGFFSLSFPGGEGGIRQLFNDSQDGGFFPIRILSMSGGGLLLLGYLAALFKQFKIRYFGRETEPGGDK
ncbi:MAG: hypothetical protein LBF78_12030 [Treponema sp.]|jgi:hypothetical protein|nr:hypothetical protein [Treponema sp.]